MVTDRADSLLRYAIIEAKAGNAASARRYIERALVTARDHDILAEAWYWLSRVTEDPVQKRDALEQALSHDMQHALARRELAVLDGRLKPEEIVDPDALPVGPAQAGPAGLDRFTCPTCGGRTVYAPDGHSLLCEFCAGRESLETGAPAVEQDFFVAMATARGHRAVVTEQVFHCQGCGAEFLLPPGHISAVCAYCASPHVVRLEQTRELIPPDGILPHNFGRAEAAGHLAAWLETQRIVPAALPQEPRGMYLPVWTFDVGGELDYRGEQVEYRRGATGQMEYVVVPVRGKYPLLLDDLPVPASRNLSAQFGRLVATFDLGGTRPYDPRYLADWPAEIYDIPMSAAALEARSQAGRRGLDEFRARIGSDIRNLSTSPANLAIESFKLVLLPLWMASLTHDGQDHLVLINGQNGRVIGEKPRRKSPGLLGWLGDLIHED